MKPVEIAGATLLVVVFGSVALVTQCSTAPTYAELQPTSSTAPETSARLPTCALTRPVLALRNTPVTALCDDVYAEDGLAPAELDALRSAWVIAVRNLNVAFETIRSSPVVVFCRSAACKMAFGASAQAAAADDLGFASAQVMLEDGSLAASAVVVTGPVTATPRILTHELVHAEMKAWVAYDLLPTWFNEGVATFLAEEPRCSPSAGSDLEVKQLVNKMLWQRHLRETGRTHDTYCAARREVERWMARFGGDHARAEALHGLLRAVARGTPFDQAFDASPAADPELR
jgi:hypothetical protein